MPKPVLPESATELVASPEHERRLRRCTIPVWPLTADAPVLDLYSRFVVAWRVGRENMSGWQIGRLSV